jgi:hypothetical protein
MSDCAIIMSDCFLALCYEVPRQASIESKVVRAQRVMVCPPNFSLSLKLVDLVHAPALCRNLLNANKSAPGHQREFDEVRAYHKGGGISADFPSSARFATGSVTGHFLFVPHTRCLTPYIPSSSTRVTTKVSATQLRWPRALRTTSQTAGPIQLLDNRQHRSTLLSYDDLRL